MKALERFIRWVCRDARYHGHYPCTVQLVHQDGTVDLTPDDAEIAGAGLSHVTVDPDAIGSAGARCLVVFDAGDPARPRVTEWEGGPVHVVRLAGGTQGVAGFGAPVEVTLPAVVTVTALLNGAVQPTAPGPPIPFVNVPFSGTVDVPPGTVFACVAGGKPNILV